MDQLPAPHAHMHPRPFASSTASDLPGKVVLVLGASSGIGAATALALGTAGARVVLAARRFDAVEVLAQQIREQGGTALAVRADVTVQAEVAKAVARCVGQFGRLDGAFNNAGLLGESAALADMPAEDFDAVWRTNVQGLFYALKCEMAAMQLTGGGAIVNTGSIVARATFPRIAAYTATKHAMLGLTRTAALEGWSQGIRVNTVSPGPIDTPMAALAFGSTENLHATLSSTPAGRPGTPDEVAGPVLFLLSSAASYINGHDLIVDGGWTLS